MLNIIVPIAAKYDISAKNLPKVFQKGKKSLYCIESILPLKKRKDVAAIYFVTLKEYAVKWNLKEIFENEFKKLGLRNARLVELEKATLSQPETIYRTIKKENISDAIFIKDADCSFSCDIVSQNSVAVYPLEKLTWVNPQHKSYVCVDDNFYITNIIEKRIIGNFFSAGGYCFENADTFTRIYELFGTAKGLYISHIVYAMLLERISFRPIEVDNYIDFETLWAGK